MKGKLRKIASIFLIFCIIFQAVPTATLRAEEEYVFDFRKDGQAGAADYALAVLTGIFAAQFVWPKTNVVLYFARSYLVSNISNQIVKGLGISDRRLASIMSMGIATFINTGLDAKMDTSGSAGSAGASSATAPRLSFGQSVKNFFTKIGDFFKNLPNFFKNLPNSVKNLFSGKKVEAKIDGKLEEHNPWQTAGLAAVKAMSYQAARVFLYDALEKYDKHLAEFISYEGGLLLSFAVGRGLAQRTGNPIIDAQTKGETFWKTFRVQTIAGAIQTVGAMAGAEEVGILISAASRAGLEGKSPEEATKYGLTAVAVQLVNRQWPDPFKGAIGNLVLSSALQSVLVKAANSDESGINFLWDATDRIRLSSMQAMADLMTFGRGTAYYPKDDEGVPNYAAGWDVQWRDGNVLLASDTFYTARYGDFMRDLNDEGPSVALMNQFISSLHYQTVQNMYDIIKGNIYKEKYARVGFNKVLQDAKTNGRDALENYNQELRILKDKLNQENLSEEKQEKVKESISKIEAQLKLLDEGVTNMQRAPREEMEKLSIQLGVATKELAFVLDDLSKALPEGKSGTGMLVAPLEQLGSSVKEYQVLTNELYSSPFVYTKDLGDGTPRDRLGGEPIPIHKLDFSAPAFNLNQPAPPQIEAPQAQSNPAIAQSNISEVSRGAEKMATNPSSLIDIKDSLKSIEGTLPLGSDPSANLIKIDYESTKVNLDKLSKMEASGRQDPAFIAKEKKRLEVDIENLNYDVKKYNWEKGLNTASKDEVVKIIQEVRKEDLTLDEKKLLDGIEQNVKRSSDPDPLNMRIVRSLLEGLKIRNTQKTLNSIGNP